MKRLLKPIHAQIEPTTRCNLNCNICCGRFLKQGDISFENFKIIISKFDSLQAVLLQGEGEPLLNKDFFKMVNFLGNKNIYVLTITNGTLLNKKNIDLIISSDLNEISISVDTLNHKELKMMKPDIDMHNILKNVKKLVLAKNQNNCKLKIGFESISTKTSIHTTFELIDKAYDLGIDFIKRKPLLEKKSYKKHYSNQINNLLLTQKDFEYLKKNSMQIKKYANSKGIIFKDQIYEHRQCNFNNSIFINFEGYATPCCYIKDYQNPYLGNLLQESALQVYNSKTPNLLRKSFEQGFFLDCCEGCNHAEILDKNPL